MATRPAPDAALAASALGRLPSALLQHEILARVSNQAVRCACRLLREHFDGGRTALRISVPPTSSGDSGDVGKLLAGMPSLQTLSISPAQAAPCNQLRQAERPTELFCLRTLTFSPSLMSLDVSRLELSDVAALQRLARLEHLSLQLCHMPDAGLDALSHCTALTDLRLTRCWPLRIPDLASCSELTRLEITSVEQWSGNYDSPRSLQSLAECSRLQHLNLSFAFKSTVMDIQPLASCSRLTFLNFDGNMRMINLDALVGCPTLRALHVHACNLEDIAFLSKLSKLTTLRTLHMGGNWAEDLAALQECQQLTHLHLNFSDEISDLAPLQHCQHLAHLDISRCISILDLRPLSRCTNLTALILSGSQSIGDLNALQQCQRLTRLDMRVCESIVDLGPLACCTNLTALDFSRCYGVSDLTPLQPCRRISDLSLQDCKRISNIAALSSLSALTRLYMGGSAGVVDITPLSHLTSLRSLEVYGLSITSIASLRCCRQLTALYADRCSNLHDLRPLSSCRRLLELRIEGWQQPTDFSPLAACTRLESLAVDDAELAKLIKGLVILPPDCEIC